MQDATPNEPVNTPSRSGQIARNVLHLGLAQVVSTALGLLLNVAHGRSFSAADFGLYYTVLTIAGFAAIVVDWGQISYLFKEAARGRADEASLIGSAMLIRTLGTGVAAGVAASVGWLAGYSDAVVWLAALAVVTSLPSALTQPFAYVFRGRDRMDLDAFVGIAAKIVLLVATVAVLLRGGGVWEVILVQFLGGSVALAMAVFLAGRVGMSAALPAFPTVRELVVAGAPFAVFALGNTLQPVFEVLILGKLTSAEVVGWFGATRAIFGTINAPLSILATATFPQLSRSAGSLPELRRVLEATTRVLLLAGAFAAAALFVMADDAISIIYGHGRFEQAVPILRTGAAFLPMMFFSYIVATATIALGKSHELAFGKSVTIALSASANWFLIQAFQAWYGNGAIAIMLTAGLIEVLLLLWFCRLLPRGAISHATIANVVRAHLTAGLSVLPFLMLPRLPFWYSGPMLGVVFLAVALATRLMLLKDIRLAVTMLFRSLPQSQRASQP
jgi:O-antigen/teichoic acid export membrane protein